MRKLDIKESIHQKTLESNSSGKLGSGPEEFNFLQKILRGVKFWKLPPLSSLSVESALVSDELFLVNGAGLLWAEYKATGDIRARNELVECYLPLVNRLADQIHARLPPNVDVSDLRSAGVFGLMDAIDAFDPQRGVKFEVYCVPRIRGAILDELRKMDWVPRLVRNIVPRLNKVREQLNGCLGRDPTDKDMKKALGVNDNQYRKMLRETNVTQVGTLEQLIDVTDPNYSVTREDLLPNYRITLEDLLEDKKIKSPKANFDREEFYRRALRGLSRNERIVMILYYREELKMKQIAEHLDLAESRISQMHSEIKAHIIRRFNKGRSVP